jgi:hypothetical protein
MQIDSRWNLIMIKNSNLNVGAAVRLAASSSLLTFWFLSTELLDLIINILNFLKPICD